MSVQSKDKENLSKTANTTIWKKILDMREIGILIPFFIMIAIVGILRPVLFSPGTLKAMARGYALFGIVAIGETLVILTGEFDVSVGSTAGLGAIMTMYFATHTGMPSSIAVLLGILICCTIGLINGLVVVKLGIKSFIATIAMLYAARGLCFVMTKGYPIYPLPEWMQKLGLWEPFGTSFGFLFFLAMVILFQWILNCTCYGKHVLAVGNDEHVARLLGITSDRIRIGVFVIAGFFACIGGILLACQMQTAMADIGRNWEMRVIAGCAIGGISLVGGAGSMIGTLIGILFLALINNGLVLLDVSTHWQDVVLGVIMVLAVYLDLFKKKRSRIVRVKK